MINMVALWVDLPLNLNSVQLRAVFLLSVFRLRAIEIINAPDKTDRQISSTVLHGVKLRNLSADISTKVQ